MKYATMSRVELEAALKRLRHDPEDLEETISFNLMFTADHIGGSQVRKDQESLMKLKEEIERIEALLARAEQ
ncbi:MAG: hypothetical protein AB1805_14360 [Nitrospirota bacterium]